MKITIVFGKKVRFLIVFVIAIYFLYCIVQNNKFYFSFEREYTKLDCPKQSNLKVPDLNNLSTGKNINIVNKNIHPCIGKQIDQQITTSIEKELISYKETNCNGNLLPFCKNDKLVGRLFVNQSIVDENALQKELPYVNYGGWWRPSSCKEIAQTAIIIPFRNRELHLPILLRQLHPILNRQHLHYRIFVIEQADNFSFNRAKLFNVGFIESQVIFPYSCFVFHDVDLIPENDEIDYGCKTSPTHLSVATDKFEYQLLYEELFGGVGMFSRNDFLKVNGFSNSFWYWGGEDDNLYRRLKPKNLSLNRPPANVARYTMIKHNDSKDMEKYTLDQRREFVSKSEAFTDIDGLNTLHYKVIEINETQFYTHIKVNLTKHLDKVHFWKMFGKVLD